MRRNEFEVIDESLVQNVLEECEWGVLSLISENEPYGIAVNFVFYEGMICFHGAPEGRKAKAMRAAPNASFLAVSPQAVIPSYFSGTKSACAATQFFVSVMLEGKIVLLEDNVSKANVLEAMMQKLQPEGGYVTMNAKNPIYTKMFERTCIYALQPKKTSLKVKVGQNMSKETQQRILQHLQKRGELTDLNTIDLMEKYTFLNKEF
jgi:uncharacterized protein